MDVVRILFLIKYQILYVTSVSSLTILPSKIFGLGESFTATCGADAIGLTNRSNYIKGAIFFRKTYSSGKVAHIASLSSTDFQARIEWKTVGIRHGKELNIQFPSRERMKHSTFDRDTMVIVAKFKALTCDDLGLYTCRIMYETGDGGGGAIDKSQTLNLPDLGSGMYLDVYPDHSDNIIQTTATISPRPQRQHQPDHSGNITMQGQYDDGESIKVTCEINSKEYHHFNWTQNCGSGFKPWPDPTQLKSQQVAEVNGTCGVRHLSQELEFKMKEECTVRCQYGNTESSDGMSSDFKFLSTGDDNQGRRHPKDHKPGHNHTIVDDEDHYEDYYELLEITASPARGSAGGIGVHEWLPAFEIAISIGMFCDYHL